MGRSTVQAAALLLALLAAPAPPEAPVTWVREAAAGETNPDPTDCATVDPWTPDVEVHPQHCIP